MPNIVAELIYICDDDAQGEKLFRSTGHEGVLTQQGIIFDNVFEVAY